MKLVGLVGLALLPFALSIPVADDTSATGKPGDSNSTDVASTSQWRVTNPGGAYCYLGLNALTKRVRRYPRGSIITATCWTTSEIINGNPWWDKTSDGCWVPEDWLEYVSGYYRECRGSNP